MPEPSILGTIDTTIITGPTQPASTEDVTADFVTGGSNRVTWAGLIGPNKEWDSGDALTDVTIDPGGADERSMTEHVEVRESNDSGVWLFNEYEANLPSAGAGNKTVRFSISSNHGSSWDEGMVLFVMTLKDCDVSSGLASALGNSATSDVESTSPASVTVSSVTSGNRIFDFFNSEFNPTVGANQTEVLDENHRAGAGDMWGNISHQDSADGGVMSWTWSGGTAHRSLYAIEMIAATEAVGSLVYRNRVTNQLLARSAR